MSTGVPPRPETGAMFALLWLSQFLSLMGTDMSKFALRVWTYESTHSVLQYALVTICVELPALLLSPLAGAIVDRYPRIRLMLLSDGVSACTTLAIYLLLLADSLAPWHIYVLNAIASAMNAIQWPAFMATATLLTPEDKRTKYGGFNQLASALSMMLSPALAGLVLRWGGIPAVCAMELATFALVLPVTASIRLPAPGATGTTPGEHPTLRQLLADSRAAWAFITSRPGLPALLGLLFVGHFGSGLVQVLMTPMVLSFASPSTLGNLLTVSGLGGVAGACMLAVTGCPKAQRSRVVLGSFLVQGCLLALCGARADTLLVLAVAFFYMAIIPISRACREAIWQSKTPVAMQGRVFALQKGLSQLALPLAAAISAPLADTVEPMLAPGGALASSVGAWIGTGPGRGAGFLFILTGAAYILVALAGFAQPELRNIDRSLPDADADLPPSDEGKPASSKEGKKKLA
jgi:DHA3 family macrolide efflux protein-like MFS transporter